MMSTEETLRLTVAALMQLTRERQPDVAAAIGLTQPQLSRRQSGKSAWTLTDCDRLAAHWGMPTLDLLAGPTHAAGCLPAARRPTTGTQTAMPLAPPAPAPPAPPTATPAPAETAPAPAPAPAAAAPAPAAPASSAAPAPAPALAAAASGSVPHTPRRAAPAGPLPDLIRDRVAAALTEAGGDADVAQAALIKRAVPDVMALFAASRVGGRYEHSEFPPTAGILQKRSQKGADAIWEGRPKWRSADLHRAARAGHITMEVTALDMNAAYLAALKTWLPIGKLTHSEGDHHDPKRSGVHLVDPGEWLTPDLPSPLGSRQEPGPLWITEPTLRALIRCAGMDLCTPPKIMESWTSGASEGLLEKMRRALVTVRDEAIANNDEVTTEYVKSMYSKFVSTIGESAANREIRRPDWMHIIRSQAFVNLWLKAHKAHKAGLTVVQVSGTDELHVSGNWQAVFPEGRGLSQVKAKSMYTLGGDE
ncbi:acyltransferase [Streptomyces albidoflavus]|uniref:acyltransferase n=1 Tax=Streptomyces albidoflavus TaxID=1886 RepID=UPI0033BACA8B|nr:acyltransferase [Streptomyces albidoflavus]WTC45613.1 acyltransferase [Streptomyces albidoflavus]WTD39976.1 acyltransferase [Streptomyces albidoflavus]WTD45564.1 acyltransferase [Streptomyces albidoflavus]WTD80162.1 acyltransferase [Streptomyces albidoflavus]